jgi:hypothetical protein
MLETAMLPLISQSSITALIGTVATSIRPIPAPEDLISYPVITYQTVSYIADYTVQGHSGWAQKRIVYNCWAASYLLSKQIQEALRLILSGYEGILTDGTQVFLIQIADGEDFFESDSRLYRASLHAVIQYAE